MRRAVVVLTVCRRYHELDRALARLRELAGEFSEPPAVVLVWARPEVSRLWYIRSLLASGFIDHVVTRAAVEGEGDDRPTTSPESHNIRLGLEFVRDHYGEGHYAVVQAADVLPNPLAGYAFLDGHMREGAGAVCLHWHSSGEAHDVWHTNFFATSLDQAYWPPVCPPGAADVLESAWGRLLANTSPPRVVKNHNWANRRFAEEHVSEGLPPWPGVPEFSSASSTLHTLGCRRWQAWLRRTLPGWLWRCIPFRHP